MKKVLLFLMSITLFASPALAGIEGSAHDLTDEGMGETRICVFCHTPHFAYPANDGTAANYFPLWNRMEIYETYDMYDSYTYDSSNPISGIPEGTSRLCLSCHDGTIAVDEYGMGSNPSMGTTMIGSIDFFLNLDDDEDPTTGIDMSNDHPVSIDYVNDTLVNDQEGDFFAVADYSGSSPFAPQDILFGGTHVECSSCHDVHNKTNLTNLLVLDNDQGSILCLTCHDK